MLSARRFVRATSVALAVQLTAASIPLVAFADVQITEEARQHFKAGVNLLNDPDGPRYEEAYREFKAAYASSPSYKILGNLGLCAMKLERDGEAIEYYDRYLQEGGKEIDQA
jgi:tetratricopeptide (TPR) repeat protein